MSTGEMFAMLFIYVALFNYSFVYLFIGELTEIGKILFSLKGTWPHSILYLHKGNGGGGTSGLLVIALCGVTLDSQEDVILIPTDGSADRNRRTGRETSELNPGGGKSP